MTEVRKLSDSPCRCHAGSRYDGLVPCRQCGHRSYDVTAGSCERRKCGYQGKAEFDALLGKIKEALA